jgi:hypothetical protein
VERNPTAINLTKFIVDGERGFAAPERNGPWRGRVVTFRGETARKKKNVAGRDEEVHPEYG